MVDVPHDTAAPAEVSAGRLLQTARERMGLSVQEAADGLNLRPAIIDALEADRYEMLPPRTFVKGYLRAYAKLVGLKEYDVLAAYEHLQPEPAPEAIPSTASAQGRRGGLKWLVVLVAVLLLGYVGYTAYLSRTPPVEVQPSTAPAPAEGAQSDEAVQVDAEAESASAQALAAVEPPHEPEDAAPEAAPLEAVSTPAEAAPAAPSAVLPPPVVDSVLVLEVNGESWVEIEDATGRRPIATLIQGPQTVQIDGSAPFRLVIGNAEAVQVHYAGEPVPLERFTRRTGVARLTVPLSR